MLDDSRKTEPRNSHAIRAIAETPDYAEAAKLLKSWSAKNDEIYRSVTEPFLERACYESVRKAGQDVRSSIWNTQQPPQDPTQRGERLLEFANSYLDFPLPIPGGLRLRDARAADLVASIEFYSKQAQDMANKAKWLKAILGQVGKKKVGTVWTNEDLGKLKDKVCK